MDSDQPTSRLFLCVYKITSITVTMKTKRAYKYRFYPTLEQEVLLSQTFGCVRFADFAWLNVVSSVSIQQSLRHQQSAFKNFWEGRAKYPTLRKKHAKQSATLTSSAFSMKNGQLYIAKSKTPLNIQWSRPLSSELSSITISKDRAGRK